MPAASARVISFFMIKPSSLNEKFPGLRTPSPSPRHLRQAIDLIGLIKRVYYLVALAWAYGWGKAIGQFIESLDSVVKKRRSEEEKGGCPPKKSARDLCGKSHTKNCSLQDILSPNICMKRLLHQAWPLLHPLSPPPGKKKDDLPPGERSSYPIKKGGLRPP